MTDDEIRAFLKPRTHWSALVTTAIVIGGTVWAVTSWLGSRADDSDVKALRNDTFQQRLDLETVKGDIKAINVHLDEGFRSMKQSIDSSNEKRRR